MSETNLDYLFADMASQTELTSDLTFLKQSVANLGNTPEANRILLIVAKAKSRREMALAEMKRDHLIDNKGFKGFGLVKKKFVSQNSIFTEEEKKQIKQLAGGSSPPPGGSDLSDEDLKKKYGIR